MKKLAIPEKLETIVLDEDSELVIPFYGVFQLPNDHCTRYARLCADFIYGLDFPIADAWQMRNERDVFSVPANNTTFHSLVQSKTITPGMLVGIHWKDSDNCASDRKYTHMSLYLGQKDRNPLFLEQFGDKIRLMNIPKYNTVDLQIREALGLRKN